MKNIPQHIVLFPDGNRRWARKRGLPTLKGHQKGYENLLDLCGWCKKRGVKVLTAFGFSTENWNRSKKEVDYLMKLFEAGLKEHIKKYKDEKVDKNRELRVRIIGQKERLPQTLQKAIEEVEELTKNNEKFQLNLAVSYGGRWDILQAVKRIIENGIPAEKINEELFEKYLSTTGLPAPDFIIRAGGEKRLSNFVLWQAAYSELYFSDKLWPDFSEEDFEEALREFSRRQRRFGH